MVPLKSVGIVAHLRNPDHRKESTDGPPASVSLAFGVIYRELPSSSQVRWRSFSIERSDFATESFDARRIHV
jgi:hypothetical protein